MSHKNARKWNSFVAFSTEETLGSESRITARRVPAARSIDRAARDFPRALFRLRIQNPVPPRVICDAIFKNTPKGDSVKGSETPIRRISHRNSTPNVIASRISIVFYAGKKNQSKETASLAIVGQFFFARRGVPRKREIGECLASNALPEPLPRVFSLSM